MITMMQIKVCYNCPDRAVGCHGKGEKYLAEREEFQRQRDSINKEKSRENGMDAYVSQSKRKYRK